MQVPTPTTHTYRVLALAALGLVLGAVTVRVQRDRAQLRAAVVREGAQVPPGPLPETGHMRRRRR